MGTRRNFSRGGQNQQHFKKLTCFRRAVQIIDRLSARRGRKRKCLPFLPHFRLKYRVSKASADGASEKFRVFCRTQGYDVIFFKFQGGKCPPPPTGAHVSVFCQGSNLHLIKFQHTREIDQNLADPLTLFLSRKIDLAEQLK